MNNRYIFRGKRTDNGKWEYGLLARYNPQFETANLIDGYELLIPVKTETVGQYTGLTDKNGKKIFEGDIVRTKYYGKLIRGRNVADYDIFKVVYAYAMYKAENKNREFNLVYGERYEIIGNIHDNPDLLEAE